MESDLRISKWFYSLYFTDLSSEESNESDSEMSFAKQRFGVKNVDSIEASVLPEKKRDDAIDKIRKLNKQLAKTKVI